MCDEVLTHSSCGCANDVLADQARRVVEEHCAGRQALALLKTLLTCCSSTPRAGTAPELRLAPVICAGVKPVAEEPVTPLAWKLGPALRPPALVSSLLAACSGKLVSHTGKQAPRDPSNRGPVRTRGSERCKGVSVVDDWQLREGCPREGQRIDQGLELRARRVPEAAKCFVRGVDAALLLARSAAA